jgi:hypothetical protein
MRFLPHVDSTMVLPSSSTTKKKKKDENLKNGLWDTSSPFSFLKKKFLPSTKQKKIKKFGDLWVYV